jgi:hypothetical protein
MRQTSVERAKYLLDDLQGCVAAYKIEDTDYSVVVSWPDIVLRYVLLQEEHKEGFFKLFRKIQEKVPLVRSYIPYRDKRNPMVAMRFQGHTEDVLFMKENVEKLLNEYAEQICQFTFLVNCCQINLLRVDDFRVIKSIQRRFGVFVNVSEGSSQSLRQNHLGGMDTRLIADGDIIENDVAVTYI